MEARPYFGGRTIRDLSDGSYVIEPEGQDPLVDLACSVCTTLYRDRDDDIAHREFGCCHACAIRWAHARREAWATGWRPTKDEVEQDLNLRAPLTFVVGAG